MLKNNKQWLYILFAVLNLIALAVLVTINHNINIRHQKALLFNQYLSQRIEAVGILQSMTFDINDPANDLFTSANIDKEEKRFELALKTFNDFYLLSVNAMESEHNPLNTDVLKKYQDIHDQTMMMEREGKSVFDEFRHKHKDIAAKHMMIMDSHYAHVQRAITEANKLLREIQSAYLKEQELYKSADKKYSLFITFFIPLFILGLIFNGARAYFLLIRAQSQILLSKNIDNYLSESKDMQKIIPDIIMHICSHLNWDAGIFWQVSDKSINLSAAWAKDDNSQQFIEDSRHTTLELEHSFIGNVVRTKKSHWIKDVTLSPIFKRSHLIKKSKLHTALAFPVIVNEEVLGVIEILNSKIQRDHLGLLDECYSIGLRLGQTLQRLKSDQAATETNYALNASAVVSVTDPHGRIKYVNQKFTEATGYHPEEVVGKNHRAVSAHYHSKEFFEKLWQTVSKGEIWRGEIKNRRKDGTFYWVDSTIVPTKDENGKLWQHVAIQYDITTKKEIEEELWATNEMRKAILESTNYAVITTDMNGVIQTFNNAAVNMLGFGHDEVVNKLSPIIFFETEELNKRATQLSRELKQVVAPTFQVLTLKTDLNRLPDENEWTFIKKDQAKFPARVSITSLRGSAGDIGGFLIIASDVSDSKKIFDELVEAKLAALAAVKAKSEFLANMSHEIRTPMNVIIGMADLLVESKLNIEQKKYAEIFKKAGENLLGVINDILDISKIESGHLKIERTEINLRSLIADTIEICTPRALSKYISLKYEIDSSIPECVLGDPLRINQILMNLLGNAIKFTRDGIVSIHLKMNTDPSVRGNLYFAITDTGIGIPKHQQDLLFKPFSQGDSSVTKEFGGTGLGLAICKKSAEMMGGEIGVFSDNKKGSTFWFTLQCPQVFDKPNIKSKVIDFGEKNIYIFDNNENNLIAFKEVFIPLGAEIFHSSSCDNALKEVTLLNTYKNKIDFIFIDFHLKNSASGQTFLRELHSHPTLKDTPIILIMDDSTYISAEDLKSTGFASVVYTPIRAEYLLNKINKIIYPTEIETQVEPVLDKIHSGLNLSILIVDDSEDNRTLVKAYLKNSNYSLSEAENGEIAVSLAKKNRYDVILMDMQMPVLDGYSATKEIRKWEIVNNLPPTPIVALTAYALIEEQEKSISAGCNLHLSKPIKKPVLLNAIETCRGLRDKL